MPRAPKKCGRADCQVRVTARMYCPTHTAETQRRANTTARGYGAPHQRDRAAWSHLVQTGTVDCWRCGQPIASDAGWHLGHDDHDRTITRGPEHDRGCNLRAAGRAYPRGTTGPPGSRG